MTIAQQQPQTKHQHHKKAELSGMPRRVLVADDESMVARSLTNDLQQLGFTVVGPVPDGRQAIEIAKLESPDMALMDIRMPVMDGIAASRILHEELNIPVVILSAYSDEEYLHAGMGVGAFGYLLKPVNLEELRLTLAIAWGRFVQHHHLSHEVRQLERKLEERKLIERAKGLIMKTLHIDEEEAMRRLQRSARDSRRPMVELARSVLDAQNLISNVMTGDGQQH